MLGQDVELADDVGQLAIARLVEGERDLTVARLLHLDDVLVVEGLARVALLLVGEHLERPDDVVRGDRLTVVPSGVLAQAVGDGGIVGGEFQRLGDQSVFRRWFVERTGHQRVVDEAEPERRRPLGRDDVQGIERAGVRQADQPALRRIRIDVVEVLEIRGIFRRAR